MLAIAKSKRAGILKFEIIIRFPLSPSPSSPEFLQSSRYIHQRVSEDCLFPETCHLRPAFPTLPVPEFHPKPLPGPASLIRARLRRTFPSPSPDPLSSLR